MPVSCKIHVDEGLGDVAKLCMLFKTFARVLQHVRVPFKVPTVL